MLVRDLQKENAQSPMEVTELGMVTLVRDEQTGNALSPMEVTELGMVTLVRDEQLENALFPMAVTFFPSSLSGMVSSLAFPLYLVISNVPSSSSVYL